MLSASAPLRLGVIGLSAGNGHPYSWSAIFNGYDPEAMASCPFPAIPRYLARQSFPAVALASARVTHVWTQDRKISEHVARASRIPHVVDRLETMIGEIDAVLLARDDAQNHFEHAAPFLEAGVPIYIDKPLALSTRDALRLLALRHYSWQIFTCSALRYADELLISDSSRKRIGAVRLIDAIVPHVWETYAAHIVEPVLIAFPEADEVLDYQRFRREAVTTLTVHWASGLQTRFTSTGAAAGPITICAYGERAAVRRSFRDAFSAFRSALSQFIQTIQAQHCPIADAAMLRVVRLIELGCS